MEGFKNLLKKKIAVYFVLILLIGGLFYFWQQSQSEIRELNKKLPPEIKIVKSLIGNEYQLVNQIDNYSFLVPKKWKGLETAKYTPERTGFGYTLSSIFVMGKKGEARTASVDTFRVEESESLREWTDGFLKNFDLETNLAEINLAGVTILTGQEEKHLGGVFLFFMKSLSRIYLFSGGSEESVKYIISHGRW